MNEYVINPPGVWGVAHIVYFVISTVLLIASLMLIKKFVKNEKTLNLIIRITAGVLLALIIANRISYMIEYIYIQEGTGYTWLNIFPETYCAVSAFSISIAALFFKKDNWGLHATVYLAIVGAIITAVYPDFMNAQNLWAPGTMTSLIYHTVMLFLAILMIITKHVKLTTRKWYIQPLFIMGMLLYGLFYWQVILQGKQYDTILAINIPLVESQPILTSWWMVCIGYLLFELAFLFIYDHFVNKKDFKTIKDEFIHFYRYINKK